MTDTHRDTICRLLVEVGEGCQRIMNEKMRNRATKLVPAYRVGKRTKDDQSLLPKTSSTRIRGELWNPGMIAGDDCDRQTFDLGPTRLF